MMFKSVARKAVAVVSEPAKLIAVSDLTHHDGTNCDYRDTVISDSA